MAPNTALSRGASVEQEEQDRCTRDALATIGRANKLESLNYFLLSEEDAGSPTHLADLLNRYMPPDCETSALCGHPIPDRKYGELKRRAHPPPHAAEVFCEHCMHLFVLSKAHRSLLPDEIWANAIDNYRNGRPTQIPPVENPEKPKRNARSKAYLNAQREREAFLEMFLAGNQFDMRYAYELSHTGERRLFAEDGRHLLTDIRGRTRDKPRAYFKVLRLESAFRHYDRYSDLFHLVNAILETGNLSLVSRHEVDDVDDIYIASARSHRHWPEGHALFFSRSGAAARFHCAFQPTQPGRRTSPPSRVAYVA